MEINQIVRGRNEIKEEVGTHWLQLKEWGGLAAWWWVKSKQLDL